MKKLLTLLFASFVALAAFASAQNVVISPQSIVVNPLPAFDVEVWVDKDTSGEARPTYQIGASIRIGVRVSEDAYIYLFSVKSNGEITQILPNRLDQAGENNFLRAGEIKYFPPEGARYVFEVDGPRGLDKVIALASKQPLNTSQLAQFQANGQLASSSMGEESFAQTLSIIVRPLPQNDWVTDTALFYVGGSPPAPIYGTLDLNSTPSGAAVYVDGQFVGYTPVRYGTGAGQHTIEFQLDGYETVRRAVNVGGGQTVSVSANLSPVQRTGTATFDSQPRGAEVIVDGTVVGITPTGPITFAVGNYQAQFRLPGYNSIAVNFTVNRNTNQLVSVDLRPQAGTLIINANVGGARVFLNGTEYGRIPSGSGQLIVNDLPSGDYQLTLVAPGFNSVIEGFQIRGGQTTSVSVRQTQR